MVRTNKRALGPRPWNSWSRRGGSGLNNVHLFRDDVDPEILDLET